MKYQFSQLLKDLTPFFADKATRVETKQEAPYVAHTASTVAHFVLSEFWNKLTPRKPAST